MFIAKYNYDSPEMYISETHRCPEHVWCRSNVCLFSARNPILCGFLSNEPEIMLELAEFLKNKLRYPGETHE